MRSLFLALQRHVNAELRKLSRKLIAVEVSAQLAREALDSLMGAGVPAADYPGGSCRSAVYSQSVGCA